MSELGVLDRFFAKRLLGANPSEEGALFLGTLMRISREGHLCCKPTAVPELPPGTIEDGTSATPKAPVIRHGDRFYLQRNWVYETYILDQVRRLRALKPAPCPSFEVDGGLLPSQRKAVVGA